jgi:peptide/nickel transport system permease protein
MGNSEAFTMARHILPNCIAPLDRAGDLDVRLCAAGRERALLPRPGRAAAGADLGQHAGRSRPYIGQAVWLGIFPGLCISLTLLGINLLGDAVRDRLDPRMRGTR